MNAPMTRIMYDENTTMSENKVRLASGSVDADISEMPVQ